MTSWTGVGAGSARRRTVTHCALHHQVKLEVLERELLEVNGNSERLARSFSELVELQLVLEKASAFFEDAQARASTSAFETRPTESARAPQGSLCSALPCLLLSWLGCL